MAKVSQEETSPPWTFPHPEWNLGFGQLRIINISNCWLKCCLLLSLLLWHYHSVPGGVCDSCRGPQVSVCTVSSLRNSPPPAPVFLGREWSLLRHYYLTSIRWWTTFCPFATSLVPVLSQEGVASGMSLWKRGKGIRKSVYDPSDDRCVMRRSVRW